MIKRIISSFFFFCSLLITLSSFAQSKTARQKETDDKLLTEYFAKNNIHPTKTHSGLYYVITRAGAGKNAWRGQTVSLNYTGMTMDGKVFDSNTDPAFNHNQPLTFSLGMGRVIKGWDEGIQLMNAGSKATLYIPSGLAYGEQSKDSAIPPNSILIFDVELLSIEK